MDLRSVPGIDKRVLPQAPLALGAIAGQDMAVVSLLPLDFAALEDCESLRSSSARFHLLVRHVNLSAPTRAVRAPRLG